MKRIWMLALSCLSMLSANALIVNVEGYGELTALGMEITINEAESDPLTGNLQMGLRGTLLSGGPISVTIVRSSAGLTDEFCCAGQCTSGNGQTEEMLNFAPQGVADWYTHYTPVAGSEEQITYIFSEGLESYTLIVHYNYQTQGIEEVPSDQAPSTKVIQDGILYIIKDNKTYTIL